MRRIILGSVGIVLLTFVVWQAVAYTQHITLGEPGAPPMIAYDITKAEIDHILKNSPPSPPDRQLRVVDMGKYNLGVGVIHRGPTNDKPGDRIQMIYHDYTPEVYVIMSGGGVVTTGGEIVDKKSYAGVNVMNGPTSSGFAGPRAYHRKVQAGDIIIIPTGVAHGWSQITDHVTYYSIRPDPERVLPAGYVYPLALRFLPARVEVK